jgi:hypothetical protein
MRSSLVDVAGASYFLAGAGVPYRFGLRRLVHGESAKAEAPLDNADQRLTQE